MFSVDDVTPAISPISSESLSRSLTRRFLREIVFLSQPTLPVIVPPHDPMFHDASFGVDSRAIRCHPLINALQTAFSQHRPLVLSPDCIWLTIAQGFSHHITENAEALRSRLVRHNGKQRLKENFRQWSPENCTSAIAGLSAKIREASDPVLHETLVCDFSTTTAEIRTASEVVLMDTYSSYFAYEMHCLCGIPAIALTGTLLDWQRVRDRIEVLETYNLGWWVARLRPILEEFIQTVKGNPSREFWQAIYKPEKAYATTSVTGWITDLFPYLGDPPRRQRSPVFNWDRENWLPAPARPATRGIRSASGKLEGVGTNWFPSGLSSVPFELRFPDDSTRMLDLVAGFFGTEQDSENFALSPLIGWCVTAPAPEAPILVG
jgi:hypothetical protein